MDHQRRDEATVARLRRALAVVQRDLDATGIDRRVELRPGGEWVVFADERKFHGHIPLCGDDELSALWSVAGNVQDLVNEVLWRAWPVCGEHDLGLHLWSDGAGPDWTPDDPGWGAPAWWCRAGTGHQVALVGRLPR